jgi:hypothetical protein
MLEDLPACFRLAPDEQVSYKEEMRNRWRYA